MSYILYTLNTNNFMYLVYSFLSRLNKSIIQLIKCVTSKNVHPYTMYRVYTMCKVYTMDRVCTMYRQFLTASTWSLLKSFCKMSLVEHRLLRLSTQFTNLWLTFVAFTMVDTQSHASFYSNFKSNNLIKIVCVCTKKYM